MKFFVTRKYLWASETPPISTDQAETFITYLILGVIVGGRLGYVLFYNLEYYSVNPIDILRIWDGGMAFHGGFLGVIVAVIMFCWANKLVLWSTADLIAISTPPGYYLVDSLTLSMQSFGVDRQKCIGELFSPETSRNNAEM